MQILIVIGCGKPPMDAFNAILFCIDAEKCTLTN